MRYRIYGILLDLAQGMRPQSKPGFLGILMLDSILAFPDGTTKKSIIVRQVVAGTAAARSGLQINDHIVAVDGMKMQPGATVSDTASARFSEYIRGKAAQAEVELDVYLVAQACPQQDKNHPGRATRPIRRPALQAQSRQ